MKKSKDRLSKKCLNPWYKFLAIFCVAAFTLFAIFEVNTNRMRINFTESSHDEESAENILIAASGASPKSSVAVQFETCPNFIVVNESTSEYVSFSNDPDSYNINAIKDFIRTQNIDAVITGTIEIGTYQMLTSSHVEVYTGVTGTAEEALKKLKKHELVSFSRRYYERNENNSLNNAGNQKAVR